MCVIRLALIISACLRLLSFSSSLTQQERSCGGRAKPGVGMLGFSAALTRPEQCLGGSGPEQLFPLVQGMLSWLSLLSPFSWMSPPSRGGQAAQLSWQLLLHSLLVC